MRIEPKMWATYEVYLEETGTDSVLIHLEDWGIIKRVRGGDYPDLWYFRDASAFDEWNRRINEASMWRFEDE